MWKRDEGGREKWEGRWIFIALRKAAGGAMHGALPEQAAPNPIRPRDGRSRKGLPFGRPLLYKLIRNTFKVK